MDLTKAQKRRLRELAGVAHEKELSQELTKLESQFQRWRAKEIDAFQLGDAIHQFHQEPARELFSKYQESDLAFAVAHAIDRGLLSNEEAGAETIQLLEGHLAFLRGQE